jgi:hypothetical protein
MVIAQRNVVEGVRGDVPPLFRRTRITPLTIAHTWFGRLTAVARKCLLSGRLMRTSCIVVAAIGCPVRHSHIHGL